MTDRPADRAAPWPLRSAPPLVLVAAPDAAVREMLQEILIGEGYRACTVATGAAALAALQEQGGADVLLLSRELQSPHDATAVLAALPRLGLEHLPRVILLSLDDSPPARQLLAPPTVGVLRTPFELDALLDLVRFAA